MTKIFIGTPCYGNMLTADYFKSCMQLVALAAHKKIELQFGTIGNESLVTRARNTLVQLFMDNTEYTHLLFIDADIAFNPESVFRMLDLDEDIVTGVYPRKQINWTKAINRVIENPNIKEDELHAASLMYNLNVKNSKHVVAKKGFIEVLDGATGFMLIKRNVFKRMALAYPHLKFKSDQHLNDPHDKRFDYHDTSDWNYAFFDTMIEPDTKRYLSEDYAFCRLWQKIGGKIYADIISGMTHMGNYSFKGNVATQFLPQRINNLVYSNMKLVDLKFQPGIDKQDTAYSAGDQRKYVDSNFVRFHYGKPERWKGWVYLPDPNKTVVGVVRDTHSWIGLDGTRYLALGTDRKLYLYSGSALYDITPIRETAALTNPFTTNGTTTVSVTDADHGAIEGDFVTFDSFSAINGLDMNNEFEVTTRVDANTYKVTHTSAASGSTSGGGGSGNANYQINIGPTSSTYGYGWGTDTWSAGKWNEPSTSSDVTVAARSWSLDNFGEDLIATVLNASTYIKDLSGSIDARATALSNAPTASRFSLVSTDTRHLMIFGTETTIGNTATQDDLLFRFSDREDATDYTPVATNEAGSLRISDGSRIVGAVKSSGQILVWTDTSLHGVQFVGTPFTFGLRQLGANCGLISQHAAVEINGRSYWMSDNSFYMYDGVVKKMPCSVQDYVFDDLSYTNRKDIACGINTAFNEIIWYYPSANATQIDRGVAYNYLENTWYTLNLGRTTWLGAYVYEQPIATEYDASLVANVSSILGLTAGASYIYEHESGNNQADGTAISAFLTTGSVEIADGDELMSVSRLVPDFDNLTNNMTATLTLEQYPQSAANVSTTGTITSTTEKIDVRGRGRAVKIKYETNTVNDTAWRLGSTKLQLRPDGRR